MGTVSIVIIIFSIVGIGFGTGMHLGVIDDSATMYKIQNLIPKNVSLSQALPLFELAFMSGQSNGLISHATVAFGLGSVVMDPDEIPDNGDEYFDNRITECQFHSDEDIDEPICVVCRIKDTHDECVNLWLGFTEKIDGLDVFPHGALLSNEDGFPNAVIPGVTITAVANTHSGGGENAVMIFDGDTLGGPGEGTTPDPDLRADADCPDCAGLHIAVIAENTVGGGDGIVDDPDDNAIGGIQTWVFDQAWFVSAFDFVDYDRSSDGEARAYSNPDCTGLVATAAISSTPNGGNGSVQTIILNANNVRCLVFDYYDSGGVTNIHLECPGRFTGEGCTPGYWKQSQHFDSWVGFVPGDLVGSVFNQASPATSGNTLLEALSFSGGPDVDGAERILLRAAVAGLLSASSPDVDYPRTVGEIVASVNTAIASGDRDEMIILGQQIDADNNAGCPLNGGIMKETFFTDSFEDENTIWGIWNIDYTRTTTPYDGDHPPNPDRIWFGQDSRGDFAPPTSAHSGTFYLGASGNIDDLDDVDYDGVTDPAWAAINRNSIDISLYTDIWLSFWYSYDNTENNDEFAMYYRVDGGAWQEIIFIQQPSTDGQQENWTEVKIGIPDGNGVEVQFRWETSAGPGSDDIVMIDDLELSGFLK